MNTRSKVPFRSQKVVEFDAGAEGAGQKKSRLQEPSAVILASDIVRWIIPKVGKFPKNVRYGLGARIEAAACREPGQRWRAQTAWAWSHDALPSIRWTRSGLCLIGHPQRN